MFVCSVSFHVMIFTDFVDCRTIEHLLPLFLIQLKDDVSCTVSTELLECCSNTCIAYFLGISFLKFV